MNKRHLFAACTVLFSSPALADGCAQLVNHNMCLHFIYSNGGSNNYTAHFGAAGAFELTGTGSTGTYTCKGRNFLEVNYAFGGFETQQWYARSNGTGTKLASGFGKSISQNYLYKISTASVGACPTLTLDGAPVIRNSQKD
jgi:hypothetical protein